FARSAMGRPAGVADAAPAADRLAHEQVRERDELAHPAPAGEPCVVDGGDPGAVIAAILEPLETLEDQRRRLVIAEDSHDATHQPALRRLISRSLSISRSPRPGFVVCRARASARAPAGTSSVTVEPAATSASAPTVTGATSAVFEPMKARGPMVVRCFITPS